MVILLRTPSPQPLCFASSVPLSHEGRGKKTWRLCPVARGMGERLDFNEEAQQSRQAQSYIARDRISPPSPLVGEGPRERGNNLYHPITNEAQ